MKSISNKVVFSATKKFLAAFLSFSFLFSSQTFAGTPQRIKSRDEIKVMLTSSDKYVKTAGIKNVLAWSLIVVVVGRIAFSAGKSAKYFDSFESGMDIGKKVAAHDLEKAFRKEKAIIESESFNRGFSLGQESMDAKLNQLYKAGKKLGYNQGFEQGFKQGYGNRIAGLAPDMSKGQHKAVLTKAEKLALEDFERQVKYLEIKLSTPTGTLNAKNKIVSLVIKAGNQAKVLNAASNPQDIAVARNELLTTVERLAQTKAPDMATKEVVREYTKELTALIRGKGGLIGMSAAAVAAAGLMFVCSQEAQSANISNTRLLVEREISRTIKQTPELLAVKAIALKNSYGLETVSSVLYEHQEALPLLQQQLAFFQSAEVRRIAAEAVQSFGWASYGAKENKRQLLNSLRG